LALTRVIKSITKRPPHRGPLFFLAFTRKADLAEPCAVPSLYCPPFFLFFWPFFFMTLFLAVSPLSLSKQWRHGDERLVNGSWQRQCWAPRVVALWNILWFSNTRELKSARSSCCVWEGWLFPLCWKIAQGFVAKAPMALLCVSHLCNEASSFVT